MTLETKRPNIIRVEYRQTSGDKNYGSCLWAFYDFDLDRYMLNIQSDCGDAAYRWVETPKCESFLHLMARCDKGYMVHKLFGEPKQVDVDDTLNEVRERFGIGTDEEYQKELTDYERREREDLIGDLENSFEEYGSLSADTATFIIRDWIDDNDIGSDIDDYWECVVTRYSACQTRIAEIFDKYIRPEIRKMLEGEEHDG